MWYNDWGLVNTPTNTVISTITGVVSPLGIAVTPDGARVYVSGFTSSKVFVIDTWTNNVTKTITVGGIPEGLAISPDGTRVYVPNGTSRYTSVIDTSTNTVITTIPVGNYAQGVAVNPASTRVYVGNLDDSTVSVIDSTTNSVITTVPNISYPEGIVVNPEGTKAYVAGDGAVFIIDTVTNTLTGTIPLTGWGLGVSITSDGTRLYVAQPDQNCVSVIDTSTNSVVTTIPVGANPRAFGNFIALLQGTTEVITVPTNLTGPTIGIPSISYTYSTEGSSSSLGHEIQYLFDWGDGTNSGWLPVGTTSASHSWSSAGTYTVKTQARCATHTSIVSGWSGSLSVDIEAISIPSAPSGPTIGIPGVNYTYSTGGSSSDLSHSVQYFFDWGDGTNSGWLPGGTIRASHPWSSAGTYTVKTQARCATHTSIVSGWSGAFR